jgi:molybdenum ABC transporter molybdate-binding protein
VLVFAAASLQTALDDLAAPVQKATGVRMRMSYASSSALARQIEGGAPAGVFISADLDWMNYLADRKLIRAESRVESHSAINWPSSRRRGHKGLAHDRPRLRTRTSAWARTARARRIRRPCRQASTPVKH